MFVRYIAIGIAVALTACSPQAAREPVATEQAQTTHSVSGLDIVRLTVKSRDQIHNFDVEVARTSAHQAKGLMFRTELAGDEGMIFPRSNPAVASFWMKNTPLPLDIIFVGTDGRILNIAANTVPYSLESVSAIGPTALVLEIPGGRSAQLGIEAGDLVEWQDR